MKGSVIAAVGTAVPGNPVRQQDIQAFAANLFRERMPQVERLLPVFRNACIERRYLAQPLEWYGRQHSFADSNKLYEEIGLELAKKAAQVALAKADIDPGDIGMVVMISSTGIATPTLDCKLIEHLGLSAHTIRMPLWGLGCAGGVTGLARTAEWVRGSGKAALMVAMELCSLTFQRNDFSKSNLVGASIFGDGAAAVLVKPDGHGAQLLDSYSTLFPETEDIMGWDVSETGLKVRFSRDIPALVRDFLPGIMEEACCQWGVDQGGLRHFVAHPGGTKVLGAYAESLGVTEEQLSDAWSVLRSYGNMSSASVLFVLEQFLAGTQARSEYGVMVALGPGFSAEQVLFRW